jgi:hypothetical protein
VAALVVLLVLLGMLLSAVGGAGAALVLGVVGVGCVAAGARRRGCSTTVTVTCKH